MNIRRATEDDFDTIAELERYAYSLPPEYFEMSRERFPYTWNDYLLLEENGVAIASARVIPLQQNLRGLWKKMGADIDFTDEELVFSALFHDLGKIGDLGVECYLPQNDNWRRDKLNEQFTINSELPFMLIQDRSLYLLQKFGIELSHNEYMAVRLHDGVYDDANKAYFFSNYPDAKFRTNIVYILHQADGIAARVEYEKWRDSSSDKPVTISKKVKGKTVKSSEGLMNLVKNI